MALYKYQTAKHARDHEIDMANRAEDMSYALKGGFKLESIYTSLDLAAMCEYLLRQRDLANAYFKTNPR